jgi:hypothetical protein
MFDSLVLANLNVLRVARENEYDGVRLKTYRSCAFEKTIHNILELRKDKVNLTFDDLENARVGGDRMMLYIEMMDYSKDDLPEVKRLLNDPHRGYIVHYVKYKKIRDEDLENIKKDMIEYLVLVFGTSWWLLTQVTKLVKNIFWSMYTCKEYSYFKNSYNLQ